jgi:multiple sugar transport system substrate-binding protein
VIGVVVVTILAVVAMNILPRLTKKTSAVTLTYWGLWEPNSVMQGVIADYEKSHPNVKITYTMQSPKNYRSRLQSAIQSGTAPDIARIHNTWLPMLRSSLTPAPDKIVPLSTFDAYYPIAKKNAVAGGKVYALPLEVDGLALLYNQDIFDKKGLTPPSDWNALRKMAYDLTERNAETGIITLSGAALGTTSNIDHWSDILGLLIVQNSGDPSKPSSTAVQDALTFYTIFATQDKTWDATQPNSVYAFATGTVAMILAPSWQVAEIKAINPNLKFGIAPVPTLPSTNVAWATYWMEAVPSSSKNSEAAWEFIKYLSSESALQNMYAAASQVHGLGEPYPLKSLASSVGSDPLATTFVSQAPNYTSWYLASRTYDEGVNDQLIKYYEDAINAINDGSTVASITKTLEEGVTQVLAKYPEAK